MNENSPLQWTKSSPKSEKRWTKTKLSNGQKTIRLKQHPLVVEKYPLWTKVFFSVNKNDPSNEGKVPPPMDEVDPSNR